MSAPNNATVRLSKDLQSIARQLDHVLTLSAGGRVSFSLVVWSDKPGQRSQYVSNCERVSVVKAMEELLLRWKQGMPDVPAHEVS